MPKKTAAGAAAAAAGAAALACGNAACGKELVPPLLRCSMCKAQAYCCKACQVRVPPAPTPAERAPFPVLVLNFRVVDFEFSCGKD